MKNAALSHPHAQSAVDQAPPLTGVIVGAGISLILWAIIAAFVFAVA